MSGGLPQLGGVRPQGCRCLWQQIHMDLPWVRITRSIECPIHGGSKAPIGQKVVLTRLDEHGMPTGERTEITGNLTWSEPAPDPAEPVGLPPLELDKPRYDYEGPRHRRKGGW